MKFFYLGKFGPHNTERYITEALEQEGHSVYRARIQNYWKPKQLLDDIRDWKADIFFFSKANTVFDFSLALKEIDIPKVCWLFDLFFDAPPNLNRSVEAPYFKADIVFTTDGGHDKEWEDAGINHQLLRQGIYRPHHQMIAGEKEIDVAFIGSNSYPYRQQLHNFLREKYGKSYHRFGLDSEVRGLALNELLGKTKVVVGDSVPTPHYWSNRLYEITGRGGFMIFPEIEGLTEEMPDMPTFRWGNFEDLKEKIDHFLTNETEREGIRLRCFQKCGEYTYDNRVKDFLCRLNTFLG